ncbi:ABC transporter substrate-binding protein [Macrococcoides bohemicum]|uniref:peptide ABC transporter substrate-binding protein n=1 Tax=Macrococcoides bohemicum TaxID=1903056 RepID=UPI000BB57495|nr:MULTISPECIES: peptide ABC transporter substrate-binding protein [Macrococcus]ATD30845.1 peptide ABC transporter substrate-binding protein [Macrococcus sp. IME1552]MBC9874321.1 peptide ABC transporter substrate-binding protein [Macrococcus bohemicus]TDL39318.1 peptide ABC transporter substrate-binding protein [Macrococcus bohemicus]
MKRQVKSLLVLFLAITMVLAACSGKKGGSGDTAGGDDKTLRLVASSDIPTMDSSLATDAVSFNVYNQTIEGLYTLDKDDKAVPAIAKGEPKISADGKKWTVELRDDAKWTNGDSVTAKDFVFAWQRALDPKTAAEYAYIMYDLKNAEAVNTGKMKTSELGVKAVNDTTLEFELEKSKPYFKELLAFGTFLPQNEKFVKEKGEKYGTTEKDTLYNGPFVLSEWKTEDKFTLTKNDKYYDKDKVKLEKITYKVLKDANSGVNLYTTGKIDRVGLPAEFIDKYKDDKNYSTELDASTFFIRMNQTKNKDLQNKDLRMALAKSIDKEKYVKNNLNNGSVAINTLMPKEFVKDEAGKDFVDGVKSPLNYDAKAAKDSFEKAKKTLGKDKFTFEFLTFDQESSKKDAEYFKEQIESNLPGVTLKIKQQPFKQKLDLESKGNYELSLGGWGPDYPDPMTFLDMFVTDGPHNQTGWSSKTYDKAIDEANGPLLTDVEKRWTTLQNAETEFLNEAVIIPIYQRGGAFLTQPYVKNIVSHKFAGDYSFKETEIKK